jgi:tetratricopeptide (TPR) repeat protein/ADP-heptose:LPS heptosyltransferase
MTMGMAQNALGEAVELRKAREFARAEEIVQRLLAENPHDADALHLLGAIARDTGRLNFSAEVLRQAIRLNSSVAEYHFDLALTVNRLDQLELALAHFRKAAELKPDYQDAVVNVGTVLHRLDRGEEARTWFERALTLDPRCSITRYNLGNVWQGLGKLDEAKRCFDEAIAIAPAFAKAHWNKSLCHLLAGEFADGWREFAWREKAAEVTIDHYTQPRWQGEPLEGKAILVHAEQGLGDEILFSTCLPDLISRTGRVIVVCEPRLAPLFARSFPRARIHGHARRKDRAPAVVGERVDFQAPIGDLPRHFRADIASFPQRTNHLLPDERRVAVWRERFAALGPGRKVGISWRAGGQPHERVKRSTKLEDWLPILAVPNIQFVNVQYGESANEISAAKKQWEVVVHDFDDGDPLVDFDDYAAKVAALDLVISVGNTTVHLAGALGVPAWALLPTVPGWRWLLSGETNPWYASVRAIRQRTAGNWGEILEEVAGRLREGTSAGMDDPRRTDCQSVLHRAESNRRTDCQSVLQARFNLHTTLEKAVDRFQMGDLNAAEPLFEQVVAHAPRNVRALHSLGQIARQNGRVDLAVRTLTRAAAAGGDDASIWLDLGCAHRAAGEHDDAYQAFRKAEELAPSNPKVFNYLGATCLDLCRLDEAERAFRRAVEICPKYNAAWNNLGCTLQKQDKYFEAIECFERALEHDPNSREARENLDSLRAAEKSHAIKSNAHADDGAAAGSRPAVGKTTHPPLSPALQERLHQAGTLYNEDRTEEAEAIAREILAEAPDHPVALRIVGVAARRAGRTDESIETLTKATQIDPTGFALQFELGVAYLDRYQQKEAFECFLRCQQLRPQFQPAYINLAGVLEQQERYEEAIPWALKAVELNPNCHLAHYNLANNYRECGRMHDAIAHYKRAVELDPGYVRADWNMGICHLHLGNYEEGWPRYENRRAAEEVMIDQYIEPRWYGEPLAGKTIVVHAEQGLGDEIVFCSCLPELIPQARRVIVTCEPRLETLFRRSFPQCKVIGYARRKDWAPCQIGVPVDYQIPMGSLPLYLRPTRASFPKRERFLIPDPALVEQWRERLDSLGPGLKVGVSWRAGGKPLERRKRSVPLELWGPVFGVPGAHFVNLQYGDASDDAADVGEQFGIELHDWEQGDPLVDIDSFAAKVAALDLVISVGNATVHVAGAVGTPAWTLLPMVPSWRWMVAGDTSPWYTSVRLFRQPRRNDWRPVFGQIGQMLAELAGSPAGDYRRRAMEVRAPLVLDESHESHSSPDEQEWLDSSQFCVKATIDSIPDLRNQADALAEKGELAEAEAIYRRILMLSPRFPGALQGLSRVARRQGKTELAIRSIKRALSIAEDVPVRRCDLAGALSDAGRYDEAAESFLRAIELDPKLFRAHFEFGLMLARLGRHEEALARFTQAAEIEPENIGPLVARAGSLRALCRPEEAIECLETLLAKQPTCTVALVALAEIHGDDQAYDDAEHCLRRAIEVDPGCVAAQLRLADLLAKLGREDEAAACCERAIELEPKNYTALVQLGTLRDQLCQPVEAERCFRWAMDSVREGAGEKGRGGERQAPRELVNSLGITLADQGRLDEALACYDEALQISGEHAYPNAHANRAFALLQLGCFAEGWREYEWRWQCPDAPGQARDHLRAPQWNGTSLAGKTILIHGEQGVGDEIMFASCYADVIQQAAHTAITCEPRLERLFRRSFPSATIIAVVRGLEHQWQIPPRLNVDVHIAAGSLPMHLRQTEASFSRSASFLQADPMLVARWRERFAALGPGLKIGISWKAGQKPKDRRLRTTQLEQWRPILETPRVHFVNLQHGDCAEEIAACERSPGVKVHHWRDADNRNDLDGLAARMAALDLVISVGNANVHLAGALGVPAWSLLPCHGGWRWLAGRSDSLWYTSVRLCRQTAPGDWTGLFLRVGQELLNRLRQRTEDKTMGAVPAPHWGMRPLRGMTNDEIRMTNQ